MPSRARPGAESGWKGVCRGTLFLCTFFSPKGVVNSYSVRAFVLLPSCRFVYLSPKPFPCQGMHASSLCFSRLAKDNSNLLGLFGGELEGGAPWFGADPGRGLEEKKQPPALTRHLRPAHKQHTHATSTRRPFTHIHTHTHTNTHHACLTPATQASHYFVRDLFSGWCARALL